MSTVAFYTLGCKVNQYDTEAMRELFIDVGYEEKPFGESCDVYVINTCTVTGTGDQKSMQAIRRAQRKNPNAAVIVAGCMAQKQGAQLLEMGVRLVLGTRSRARVVELLTDALARGVSLCAVESEASFITAPYERLSVAGHTGRTRAVMKIQEGCENRCTYCIIPSVRGPVRSRPIEDIRREASALKARGDREIVITGIHLGSYGRDVRPLTLLDALRAIAEEAPGLRLRLGSLEPNTATDDFVQALTRLPGMCPQFHLALQSGSDSVLRRMKRAYNTQQFLNAAARLREAYPNCALTTDIMAGFPGETEAEHRDSLAFCERVGFSRMHVFPFSPREGTPAAVMPDPVSETIKERRAAELRALGHTLSIAYRRSLLGLTLPVLFEEEGDSGAYGYTPQYVRVAVRDGVPGEMRDVRLTGLTGDDMCGDIVSPSNVTKL